MMKQITLVTLIVFCLCIFGLSSCGNGDEPGKNNAESQVSIAFNVAITESLSDYLNLHVDYFGPDGVRHTEVVSTKKWSKVFKNCKLTDKVGYTLKIVRNSEPVNSNFKCAIKVEQDGGYTTYNTKGEIIKHMAMKTETIAQDPVEDITSCIEFLNKTVKQIEFQHNK